VDRIYNENLDEADRQPACVQACPSRARHFGDLGDPESDVSKLVAARSGVDLMPEFGYRPTNKYLPPRPRRAGGDDVNDGARDDRSDAGTFANAQAANPLKWLDRILRR
jgi:hypothetical protein